MSESLTYWWEEATSLRDQVKKQNEDIKILNQIIKDCEETVEEYEVLEHKVELTIAGLKRAIKSNDWNTVKSTLELVERGL